MRYSYEKMAPGNLMLVYDEVDKDINETVRILNG